MNNYSSDRMPLIILLICLVLLFGFLFWHANRMDMEAEKECVSQNSIYKDYPAVYSLEALFGETKTLKSGSFSGSFFLFVGGVSGEEHEEGAYLLKYAYKDTLGIKLMVERVENDSNIRIIESDIKQPVLRIYRSFTHPYGYTICRENPVLKVFEVPRGTILKGYDVNLNK